MSSFFRKLLGVNWKTTLAGITALIAVVGKIVLALRTKDFATVFTSASELSADITLVLVGIGLLNAKDNDTAGAGETARKVGMVLLIFGLLFLAGPSTRAQTTELSIGPSLVRVNPHFTRKDFKFNQSTDQVGADVSLSHYFKDRNVGFTVDLGFGAKGTKATDSSLGTAAIGPAWKYQKHRVEPFARLLFGVSRLAATNQQLKFDKSNAGFAFIAGGGVDVALSKRFALRVVQVDYLGTRILGSTVNHARASAGVVVSF